MGCDVSFAKPCLKDEEEIARLLSSPNFYDEATHQINFAAFNLRLFSNGEKETYVSLSRISYIKPSLLDKKGKYIFKKTSNNYIGYALFKPVHLLCLQRDRLKLFPVRAGGDEHCGMFFLNEEHKLMSGDLTGSPFALKTMRTLCKLLKDKVIVKK